jgi:hypothetical protein
MENNNKELNNSDFDEIIQEHFQNLKYENLNDSEIDSLETKILDSTKASREKKKESLMIQVFNWIKSALYEIIYNISSISKNNGRFKPVFATLGLTVIFFVVYFIFFNTDDKQILDSNEKASNSEQIKSEEKISARKDNNLSKNIIDNEYSRKLLDEMIIILPKKSFFNKKHYSQSNSDSIMFLNSSTSIKRVFQDEKIQYAELKNNSIITDWYYFRKLSGDSLSKSRLLVDFHTNKVNKIEFIEESFTIKNIKVNIKPDNFYSVLIKKIKTEYYKIGN